MKAVFRLGMIVIMLSSLAFMAGAQPPGMQKKLLLMSSGKGKLVKIRKPDQWYSHRQHLLDSMQAVMGPLPDSSRLVPPAMEVLGETIAEGVRVLKITFASEPGDRVPAYLMLPENITGKVPAILCLHQTISMGKAEPAGLGGSDNLHYALELARRGYITLAPDYPNFGDYSFDPYSHGYVSATMKGIWNHMAAVNLLCSLPQADPSRIGCIGHSLGGHNSLFLAAFDKRIKAVVSSCGFNSFYKYNGGDLTGWSHRGYMPRIASKYGKDPARMPFDFTGVLAAIAPRAIFVNAPLGDSNFEVSGVRDCIDAVRPVYELLGAMDKLVIVYPDALHDFPPEAREAAYRFLDSELSFTPQYINSNDKP